MKKYVLILFMLGLSLLVACNAGNSEPDVDESNEIVPATEDTGSESVEPEAVQPVSGQLRLVEFYADW